MMGSRALSKTRRDLPDFDRPPVIETVLGFVFAPIPGWDLLHYGLLWERFKREYPLHEVKQAIGQVELQIGSDPQANFGSLPIRCWFIKADNTQLVQVQNTALFHNWRTAERNPDYVHYENTRDNFAREWREFCKFLSDHSMPPPSVYRCEVTYINHLVRGAEWQSFEDLKEIFRLWQGQMQSKVVGNLQLVSFVAGYALPNTEGQLQFSAQPGVRRSDGREIIQLTITASGKPADASDGALFSWLDIGHAAVVTGFRDFTSDKMHHFWGIK